MGTLLGALVGGVLVTAIAPFCFGASTFYAVSAGLATLYGLRWRRPTIVVLAGFIVGNQLVAIPLDTQRRHVAALHRCEIFATPQMVRLQVVDLPANSLRPSRFQARILAATCAGLRERRLNFSWYTDSRLQVGQTLLVVADFKPLASTSNFGLVDHELRLRRSGYSARARVLALVSSQPGPVAIGQSSRWAPDRLWRLMHNAVQNKRLQLREKLQASELSQRGALLALLTGDSSLLQGHERDLLQATGTSHLLVISGLHVGIVTTLIIALISGIQRACGLAGLALPPFVLTVAGSAVLLIYVLFVGAHASAVRALCMSLVALYWFRHGRLIAPGWAYLVAFLVVVLLQPMASLSAGFWLSFGLVGWLIAIGPTAVQSRLGRSARLRALAVLQLGLTAIMAPLLSWLGLPIALGAVFANLVAVPLVSLVVVPGVLLLAGCELLLPPFGPVLDGLYGLTNALLDGLMGGLAVLAQWFPVLVLYGLGPLQVLLLSTITGIVLLPVTDLSPRCAALLALVSFYAQSASSPLVDRQAEVIPWGDFRVEVLDVGPVSYTHLTLPTKA